MAVLYHLSPALSAAGQFVSGARAEFYSSGTSTGQEVYDDDDRTISAGIVISSDAAGRFPPVYLQNEDYRVVVKTPGGEVLYEIDPVHGRPVDKVESEEGISLTLSDDGGPGGAPSLVSSDLDAVSSFRNCCRAYAWVDENGDFDANADTFNIFEVQHNPPGRYTVSFGTDSNEQATIYNKPVAQVTPFGAVNVATSPKMFNACIVTMNSKTAVVQITDETGTRTDCGFMFALFGRMPEPSS